MASSRGAQLLEILSLGGQPDPNLYDHYEKIWLQAKSDWDDREKLHPNTPDWATRVMWKSKSFMAEYWRVTNQISVNPFALSQEELLWSLQLLIQQLLDMKLIAKEDLKLKKSSLNFLQRIALVPDQILEAGGSWEKIQKAIKTLFPITPKCLLYAHVRKQDWSILQSENLDALHTKENIAVPKFRFISDNYR